MKRFQLVVVVAGVVLFASAVLAVSRTVTWVEPCLTSEQVLRHMDNSRNGISLTCNEQVRQQNLARNR